jgi:hypothetical protein
MDIVKELTPRDTRTELPPSKAYVRVLRRVDGLTIAWLIRQKRTPDEVRCLLIQNPGKAPKGLLAGSFKSGHGKVSVRATGENVAQVRGLLDWLVANLPVAAAPAKTKAKGKTTKAVASGKKTLPASRPAGLPAPGAPRVMAGGIPYGELPAAKTKAKTAATRKRQPAKKAEAPAAGQES